VRCRMEWPLIVLPGRRSGRWSGQGSIRISLLRGRPAGCRYHRVSAEECETIGLMHAAGFSDAQIGAVIGRDRSTVWRKRRRIGNAGGGVAFLESFSCSLVLDVADRQP
jgi:hypothetical protein